MSRLKRVLIISAIFVIFLFNTGFAFNYSVDQTVYPYVRYVLPNNVGFKSYMDYRKITNENSNQYKLQEYCSTNYRGLRMIDGRYCIAIGTLFNASVGQKVDLTLENGIVINCIIGDIKDDKDTDDMNLFTLENGCCSEFIIEKEALPYESRVGGDISKMYTNWNSPVIYIDIYPEHIILEQTDENQNIHI